MAEEKTIKDDVSLEEIQEMVRTGRIDVKATDCDGNSILHEVCHLNKDKSEIIEYLVGEGAAVNQVNREGFTPLIICAGKGYIDGLRVLINKGACVNPHGAVKKNKNRDSAVIAAARNGHEECMDELIKHGADIWYRVKNNGDTLLSVACEVGLPVVIKHCLDNGNEAQMEGRFGKSPLHLVCQNGNVDCLRLLLSSSSYMRTEHSLDEMYHDYVSNSRQTFLLTAAENKHEECVFELMSAGASISRKKNNDKSLTLIHVAAAKGLVKVLKECLRKLDSDEITRVNSIEQNAIMLACENNQYECLQVLLEAGMFPPKAVDKESGSFTALMVSAMKGYIECLRLLINHGVEINSHITSDIESDYNMYKGNLGNGEGNSAILLAAKSKREDCVKVLIEAGADIWCKNSQGQNLLMVASEQGLVETVEFCLSKSSWEQVTLKDTSGDNALLLAYNNHQDKCLKVLLGVSKQVSEILVLANQEQKGSILQKVCQDAVERPEIADLFASNSSLIDSVDSEGRTPLMLCAQQGYLETLKVLLKHGANTNAVQICSGPNISFKVGKDIAARNTALLMAAELGHEECVLELMDSGADIWYQNNHSKTLLTVASAKGLLPVVKKCLDSVCCDVKFHYRQAVKAITAAIESGKENCALKVIEHTATHLENEAQGATILKQASAKGMRKVLQKLLSIKQLKFDIGAKNAALMDALLNNHQECALELIASGADIFCSVDEHIHNTSSSISKGNQDLYSDGKGFNRHCGKGKNVLMLAAEEGFVEVIRFCEHKLGSEEINKTDREGKSALFHAVYHGCIDVVKELLTCGAHPSVLNPMEIFPHVNMDSRESLARSEDCLCEVIKQGADFTGVNEYGVNLFMAAAKYELLQLVKIIIEKGDEQFLTMTDSEGYSAMEYIPKYDQQECLEELLKSSKCSSMKKKALDSYRFTRYCRKKKDLILKFCSGIQENAREIDIFKTAKAYGRERNVLECVRDGIDVWHTDSDGQNLLMIAADRGMPQVVRYCLAMATYEQIHTVDNGGRTAIMMACESHSLSYEHFKGQKRLDYLLDILEKEESFKRQTGKKPNRFADIDAQIYGNNQSLMHLVCSEPADRADIVKKLIEKGASVNQYNAEGLTPLITCAMKNNVSCLVLLLQNAAHVNAVCRSTDLQGSLHLAAREGHEECVKLLTEHGADIWYCDNKGENLLMIAAANGMWNTVRYCLDHGTPTQISKADKNGNNAMIHACKNAQISSLVFILQSKPCLSQVNVVSVKLDMSPLMIAMDIRCIEAVRMLLQKGADPNYQNSRGITCLLMAVGKNPPSWKYFGNNLVFHEFVALLLESGADVNHVCSQTGETALTVAAKAGAHASVIEELLKHGADPNHYDTNNNIPLLGACESGSEEAIKHLLNHKASVERASRLTGKSLLAEAVIKEVNPEAIQMLINHGASVNQVGSNGDTALLNACRNSQENVANLLLQNEANVNSTCKESGDSPLILVAQSGNTKELTSKILNHGAYVNHANNDNNTALLKACENSHQDIVELLLDHGATANHVCKVTGNTALLYAVQNDFTLDVIELLMTNGPDVNKSNVSGETVLKIACNERNFQLVKLFLKHGASISANPLSSMGYISHDCKNLLHIAGINISTEENPDSPGEGIVLPLFDLCRVPARQHVMKCFPDSNLLHTIPRLVLPSRMKRFLLYDDDIDDNDAEIPDMKNPKGQSHARTQYDTYDDSDDAIYFPSSSYRYYDSDDNYYDSDY